jgi:hypothetical protein
MTDLSELDIELKPADLRSRFLRAIDVLLEIAENKTGDTHMRMDAVRGIDLLYTTVAAKDFAEESVTKATRSNDKLTDEVRRARRKSWEDDGKEK